MSGMDILPLFCECLKPGPRTDQDIVALREKLLRGSVDWKSLIGLADRQLLCPTLYCALKDKGLLSYIPSEACQCLSDLYELNRDRNRNLADHILETSGYLNAMGVEPVLLKGAANIFSGLYSDRAMRFLFDIDLLVPRERLPDCIDRLQSCGYRYMFSPEGTAWEKHHHIPPLLKDNQFIRVEIHQEPAPRKYSRLLDAATVIRCSTPLPTKAARLRIPLRIDQVIHNIIHAQLGDSTFSLGEIQLRQLYDFVLMAGTLESGSWHEIVRRFRRAGCLSAFSGYVLAAGNYFGFSPPFEIGTTVLSRLYIKGLHAQTNHHYLMRLGSVLRLLIHYWGRLRDSWENGRMPRFWSNRRLHFRQMTAILNRNW
jgi:hypothetical protein